MSASSTKSTGDRGIAARSTAPALADFADQNELDYAALTNAVKTGRVTAQTGL